MPLPGPLLLRPMQLGGAEATPEAEVRGPLFARDRSTLRELDANARPQVSSRSKRPPPPHTESWG